MLGMACTLFVVGAVLLLWSADRFVAAASSLATRLGVPSLVVGIAVVGFATSLPEILVSLVAAYQQNAGLSIGNALGSYVTNISLVLGLTACLVPLTLHAQLLRREYPLMLLALLLCWLTVMDGDLTRVNGLLLLGLFSGMAIIMGLSVARDVGALKAQGHPAESLSSMSLGKTVFWLLLGLGLMVISSRLMVHGAVKIAHFFGVSELMIGLTVVAVGTSLPELAASIVAALRGEHDIAVGNVIGSNLLGILGVMAMPALLAPGPMPTGTLTRDFPAMWAVTALLFAFSYLRLKPQQATKIGRIKGGLLLCSFVGYLVLVIRSAG